MDMVTQRGLESFLSPRTLDRFATGPPSLLLSRETRRALFWQGLDAQIRRCAPHGVDQSLGNVWASDGSLASDLGVPHRLSGGVAGPVDFTFALYDAAEVAESEIVGITLATLAAEIFLPNQPATLFSDHQNATRAIGTDRSGQAGEIRRDRPFGASYSCLRDVLTGRTDYELLWVRAHTAATDLGSQLNARADAKAHEGHTHADVHVGFPDFALPDYAVRFKRLWWEGNISLKFSAALEAVAAARLPTATAKNLHILRTFRPSGPSANPYLKSTSGYAAKVQLMLRCDQLPCGSRTGGRLKSDRSCPTCFADVETESHTFWFCPSHAGLRNLIGLSLKETTRSYLFKMDVDPALAESLEIFAGTKMKHWEWWRGDALHGRPPEFSLLPSRVQLGLEHAWHGVLIIGAARIWGVRMRAWGKRRKSLK
ncbi:hypothetical protein P7C70_g4944, partial [Phenoliferia sp. Uapishka_3]